MKGRKKRRQDADHFLYCSFIMKGRKKANYVTLKKNEILDSRLLTKKIIKIEAKAQLRLVQWGVQPREPWLITWH
jgi:hypothetical protein